MRSLELNVKGASGTSRGLRGTEERFFLKTLCCGVLATGDICTAGTEEARCKRDQCVALITIPSRRDAS